MAAKIERCQQRVTSIFFLYNDVTVFSKFECQIVEVIY